jgi:5'-3' exonuclease
MGVPKFFSYLLKKYKNDAFLVNRETSIQSYKTKLDNLDYLLLDANGFMHPAC